MDLPPDSRSLSTYLVRDLTATVENLATRQPLPYRPTPSIGTEQAAGPRTCHRCGEPGHYAKDSHCRHEERADGAGAPSHHPQRSDGSNKPDKQIPKTNSEVSHLQRPDTPPPQLPATCSRSGPHPHRGYGSHRVHCHAGRRFHQLTFTVHPSPLPPNAKGHPDSRYKSHRRFWGNLPHGK